MNILFWQKRWYQQPWWLTVFAVLAAGIIFGGLFFYTHWFLYRDTLIKKIPEPVVFYMHFDLPYQFKNNQAEINQFKYYQWLNQLFIEDDFNFTQDILPLSREIALAVYLNKDTGSLDWVLLARIKNKKSVQVKLPPGQKIFYQFLDHHSVVFAHSSAVLADFINQSIKRSSLADNLLVQQNFRKFSPYAAGKIYFNLTTWPADQKLVDNFFTQLFIDFLKQQNTQAIFVEIKKNQTDLVGQLVVQPPTIPLLSTDSDLNKNPIQTIPAQTVALIQGINWARMFKDFMQVTPETDLLFKRFRESYEQLYQFSWSEDILPLIDGPSELLLIKDGQQLTQDWWPKNNFILLIYPQTDLSSAHYQKLETIIKEMFAHYLPGERQRALPDESIITELVADPEHWQFVAAEAVGYPIRFIKDDELKLEFVYSPATIDQPLVLSNSLSQLTAFWHQRNNQTNDWLSVQQELKISSSSSRIFLNLTELGVGQGWFNFTKILIQPEGDNLKFRLF